MSRRVKDNLARAAEEKSGTFGEMMSGALEGGGQEGRAPKPRAGWGTPRPDAAPRGRRDRAGAIKLHAVESEAETGDDLARSFDRATVESLYDALDLVMPMLHANDQSIYMHLFRRTIAAGKSKCDCKFRARFARAGCSASN